MHWRQSHQAANQKRAWAPCRSSISQETTWMKTAPLYLSATRTCGSCIWLITSCCPSQPGTRSAFVWMWTNKHSDVELEVRIFSLWMFVVNSVNWRCWRSWIWVGISWKRFPPLCPAARDYTPSSPTPTISVCSLRSLTCLRLRLVCHRIFMLTCCHPKVL